MALQWHSQQSYDSFGIQTLVVQTLPWLLQTKHQPGSHLADSELMHVSHFVSQATRLQDVSCIIHMIAWGQWHQWLSL